MVTKAYFAQGDTEPPLEVTPLDENGDAIPLDAAVGVTFTMKKPDGDVVIDAATGEIDVPSTLLRYIWGANETATLDGSYDGRFRVEWSSGKFTSFPNHGYIPIEFSEGLA